MGKIFDVIKSMTIEDWIRDSCSDGDTIKVVKTQNVDMDDKGKPVVCNMSLLHNKTIDQMYMITFDTRQAYCKECEASKVRHVLGNEYYCDNCRKPFNWVPSILAT